MSNDKLIPSNEPEGKVYEAIRNELSEKKNVREDTLKLRYKALSIIVNKSSIGHPISTTGIYNSLKEEYECDGSLETIESMTPMIANLQRGMPSYIGRTRICFGTGKKMRFNAAYFFRIDKNSVNADVRNDAEIIQKRFLDVLGEYK